MWYLFFVVGGLWFWVLSCIAFVLLCWAVEDEKAGFAFVSIAIYVLLIHLFGDAAFFTYVKANPANILLAIVGYVGIGFVWSFGKYYFKLSRYSPKLKEYAKKYEIYLKEFTPSEHVSHSQPREFQEYVYHNCGNYEASTYLDFKGTTKSIVFWTAYWPASLVGTLLTDIVSRVVEYIYEQWLIGAYRAIHRKVLGSIVPDKNAIMAMRQDTPESSEPTSGFGSSGDAVNRTI